MRWAAPCLIELALGVSSLAAQEFDRVRTEQAALAVLDDFMTAFNGYDAEAWSATLHYPHFRHWRAGRCGSMKEDRRPWIGLQARFDDCEAQGGITVPGTGATSCTLDRQRCTSTRSSHVTGRTPRSSPPMSRCIS